LHTEADDSTRIRLLADDATTQKAMLSGLNQILSVVDPPKGAAPCLESFDERTRK